MFSIPTKNLIRTFFIDEDGYFKEQICHKYGQVVWEGRVPRIQFYRAFVLWIRYRTLERKVALLDNGDITSSNE